MFADLSKPFMSIMQDLDNGLNGTVYLCHVLLPLSSLMRAPMARQDGVARYDHNLKENRYPRKIACRLNRAFYNSAACNPNKGEFKKQAAQAAQPANDEQTGTSARPVKSSGRAASRLTYGATPRSRARTFTTLPSAIVIRTMQATGKRRRASARQISRFYPSFQVRHFRPLVS
jgi:hypothetical protein